MSDADRQPPDKPATFVERVTAAVDEVAAVTAWAERHAATRERDGRQLSEAVREQLVELATQARAAADAIELLAGQAPEEDDAAPPPRVRALVAAELDRLQKRPTSSYTAPQHFDGPGSGPTGSDSRAGIRRSGQVPTDDNLPDAGSA